MSLSRKKMKVRAMYRRWLKDEKILDELAVRPEPQYSDISEILRNLGSAIAYAQAYVKSDDAVTRPDQVSK